MKRSTILLLTTALTGAFLLGGCKADRATGPRSLPKRATFVVAADPRYIVVLRDGAGDPAEVARTHGVTPARVYRHALRGFAAQMNEAQVAALSRNPNVKSVSPDGVVTIGPIPADATTLWNLDRIDQASLPLDGQYNYPPTAGAGVHVYILDSGIRTTHVTFGGRASWFSDFSGATIPNEDCLGHGTHVAGTVGGAAYGVAKAVTLHAARVFGCFGSAEWSTIIAGLDDIVARGELPGVINMSLSGTPREQAMDAATEGAIAAGFTVALAAGNSNADACNASPAGVPAALTVAASANTDARATFSNHGLCVDLYAPGVAVTSAYNSNDIVQATLNGTSMSAPHVAGAAALLLGDDPTLAPAAVHAAIVGGATPGVIVGNPLGTANLLLRVGTSTSPPPPPPPECPEGTRLRGKSGKCR